MPTKESRRLGNRRWIMSDPSEANRYSRVEAAITDRITRSRVAVIS